MKHLISLVLAFALVFALVSCGSQPEPQTQENTPPSSSAVEIVEEPEEEEAPVLFESDGAVNDFLTAYNAISDSPADDIKQGNIRTKAIADADGLYMVVTHAKGIGAPDYISVEISGTYDEKLTGAFSAALRAVCDEFTAEEISTAIDDITNHLYDIDYSDTGIKNVYDVHGVQMLYVKDRNVDGAGRFELKAQI